LSPDHLGLFDTPPDRQQGRFALVVVGLLVTAVLAILPVRNIHVGLIPSYVPAIDAIMCLGDLISAALLFAQASVFGSRALTVLAATYVYMALILIPHALTFPGAFSPDGFGWAYSASPWLSIVRRSVFPLATLAYVRLKRAEAAQPPQAQRPAAPIFASVLAAAVLAAAAVLLSAIVQVWLPPFFAKGSSLFQGNSTAYESVELALFVVAAIVLFRARTSVLDLWLLVSFAGWLMSSGLILTLKGQYTVGWYWLYAVLLFSHLVVMFALLAECNRLYARLAVAVAARSREREARLMSIDAVAVAIAHEVGQPLTAVNLQAKSGMNWLARQPPNVERAVGSLRAIIEAANRTGDVVNSFRGMFAKRPGLAAELSLNDLVRATASLFSRELAAARVSLQLSLDEGLPPVLADRVQMQRVLINLFTNAIDALAATRDRPRRISVVSSPLGAHEVLLEVSDNGSGLAPEEAEHIFEAFHTTKPTGSGVGLSLCRTIVSAHGGLLWATPGKPNGATFHLQLPRGDQPATSGGGRPRASRARRETAKAERSR
jgi:signal transduction histidine kinase